MYDDTQLRDPQDQIKEIETALDYLVAAYEILTAEKMLHYERQNLGDVINTVRDEIADLRLQADEYL